MKRICLVGPIDKRILIYPLIKTLMYSHNALIITDDGSYRRILPNYDSNGTIEHVGVITIPDEQLIDEKYILEKIEFSEEDLDYIIYVTTNRIIDNCDQVIYFKGSKSSFCTDELDEKLTEMEVEQVIIDLEVPNLKSNKQIRLGMDEFHYLYTVEQSKQFLNIKNKKLLGKLAVIISFILDITQNNVISLMNRATK